MEIKKEKKKIKRERHQGIVGFQSPVFFLKKALISSDV